MTNLNGKTALITGASGSIGRAITKKLHGMFFPPALRQMVGIMFVGAHNHNPVACFPLPFPTTSKDNTLYGDNYDDTLKGKYAILATRHIIKYNQHETVIDVVTDSTEKPFVSSTRQTQQTYDNY